MSHESSIVIQVVTTNKILRGSKGSSTLELIEIACVVPVLVCLGRRLELQSC